MSETAERLKTQLAGLSIQDRAELATFLIRSLDEGPEAEVEAAWKAELDRRYEEIKSGEVEGIPAEQVFSEMRAKYS